MGDCLRAGKPSRYVTSWQPPKSTQLSIPPRQVNQVPGYLAGVKAGRVHLCRVAPCQVTLCDPIWQVTLRSSVMRFL